MNKYFVAILMGSKNDLDIMQHAASVLKSFDISYEIKVLSAHRTPEATKNYVLDAEKRGCEIFICGAGLAAHLAGCVASMTLKPVLGVPLASGSLQGMDSLLSTAQMPGGIPVACLAIGKAGSTNAGYLSAQILGIKYPVIHDLLIKERRNKAEQILEQNAELADL